MEISNRAKERFCKDCNIPIRLFQEPYFLDRIKLFDDFMEQLINGLDLQVNCSNTIVNRITLRNIIT